MGGSRSGNRKYFMGGWEQVELHERVRVSERVVWRKTNFLWYLGRNMKF